MKRKKEESENRSNTRLNKRCGNVKCNVDSKCDL